VFPGEMKPITPTDLDATLFDLASDVTDWGTGGQFTFVKTLQEAVRNHGRVDLMTTKDTNIQIAVKRMPTRWVRVGPKEFKEHYPTASERPWHDIGFVKSLNKRGFPHVCDLIGIFRDDANTFVAVALANQGDLFAWCDVDPRPGRAREVVMKPLVTQIFGAVRWIHACGIAHRDLSLENILLNRDDTGLNIKIIDFGMGTLKRWCLKEVRGKQSYQAPEMHGDVEYDGYLTDGFALGVVVFAMAVQDYPWISTKRNTCQLFEYVSTFGFEKLLERRKLRKGNGERLIEVLSEPLVELLLGLLTMNPPDRACLGEPQFEAEKARPSIWDKKWMG